MHVVETYIRKVLDWPIVTSYNPLDFTDPFLLPHLVNFQTSRQIVNFLISWFSINKAKMMHMTFYWSKNVTILIDSWKTDSWTSYLLSLLACLLASAFYQYLENRRLRLKAITFETPSTTAPQNQIPLLRSNLAGDKAKLGVKLAGAFLFGFNSAIGYLMMLAVMSFNGGVLVAIVVGLAIGCFFFRSESDEGTFLVADNACACA